MATAISKKRRRGPGQACDSCHKKKSRCYWRPPACADCLRLRVACTFDREGASKPINFETSATQSSLSAAGGHADSEPDHAELAGGQRPSSTREDILSRVDVPRLIAEYFATINHVFPLLDQAFFKQWSEDGRRDDHVFRDCLHGLLALALQHAQLSASDASDDSREAWWSCLSVAISGAGKLVMSSASLRSIQTLAILATSTQWSEDGAEESLPTLAMAIRFAYRFNLHHLDEVEGLSVAQRMEYLRVFWCLYILDRSMSMRLHLPPIIDDRDLNVITPKTWSFDGVGLIRSLNDASELNLFTARQRLAVISGDIWHSLCTFSGERQPVAAKFSERQRLQFSLLDWKRQRFTVNHPATEWSSSHLVSIAMIQFEYFHCLLKTDPEIFPKEPKTLAVMDDSSSYIINLQSKVQSGTAVWVGPARETLTLAAVVRKGGWMYLRFASQYVVPAILILSAATAGNPNRLQAESDRELCTLWRALFHHIAQDAPAGIA